VLRDNCFQPEYYYREKFVFIWIVNRNSTDLFYRFKKIHHRLKNASFTNEKDLLGLSPGKFTGKLVNLPGQFYRG
jgi:hypothetical protein